MPSIIPSESRDHESMVLSLPLVSVKFDTSMNRPRFMIVPSGNNALMILEFPIATDIQLLISQLLRFIQN